MGKVGNEVFDIEEIMKTCVHPDMPKDMYALVSGKCVHLFKVKGEETVGPIKLSKKASRVFLSKLVPRGDT